MTNKKGDFFEALGQMESGGNYEIVNDKGYLGKYQMGEPAMVDAGYYKKPSRKWNNDWSGTFTGKDNVYSKEDFLKNPQAQENAQRIFKKQQWKSLRSSGIDKYINKENGGVKMTPSGLLGGTHLGGPGGVFLYINSEGKNNAKDDYGTTVGKYIERFNGYDVSDITGIPNDYNLEDYVVKPKNTTIQEPTTQVVPISNPIDKKSTNDKENMLSFLKENYPDLTKIEDTETLKKIIGFYQRNQ